MTLPRNCVFLFAVLIFISIFDQYASQLYTYPSQSIIFFPRPMMQLAPQPMYPFPTYPLGFGYPVFPAHMTTPPPEPSPTTDIPPNNPVEPEDYIITNNNNDNSNPNRTRVIGGRDAYEGELPYQVSIKNKLNKHYCGGCLIRDQWVLTAAHCTPMATTVTMGSLIVDNDDVSRKVVQRIRHPQYNQTLRLNDLALLKLDSKVELTDNVKILPLPENDVVMDVTAILSGWGYVKYQTLEVPSKLQLLKVKMMPNSQCSVKWKPYKIHPTNICTESPKGEGSCKGDSGGPLAFNDELIGIVSFGAPCALGFPDVYTNTYPFKSWIDDMINENSDRRSPILP